MDRDNMPPEITPTGNTPAIDAAVVKEKLRQKANKRLASLDALRGLNMLCIIGLASLIAAICNLHAENFRVFGDAAVEKVAAFREHWKGPSPDFIKNQMDHVTWNGLRHHDTIFPLFLFLAGVSFPFSFAKQRANGRPVWRVCLKIVCRGLALFVVGYFYQNKVRFDFPNTRFMGVLQHIGLAWMIAAFLYLCLAKRIKTQVAVCAAILVAYWLGVALIPARDVCGDEAFTADAFKHRAAQLFVVRAFEKLPDLPPQDENNAEASDENVANITDAQSLAENENGAVTENVADSENEEPTAKKHSFKGLVAGLFEEDPLPNFDDPNYPEPGTVDHNLLPEGCVVNYFDRQYVPCKLYHDRDNVRKAIADGEIENTYNPSLWRNMRDPEGLACTFPAIVTALLGMLFGGVLRKDDLLCPKMKKVGILVGYGVILLVVGFLWHLIFPINKNLWNSSFVCFVGGYSALALACSYLLIDVLPLRWLGWPFAVIGMNSIAIFVIRRIVDFTNARNFFFADAIERFVPNSYPDPNFVPDPSVADPGAVEIPMIECGAFQNIATIVAGLIVAWLFLFWLYKKKIFIKL